MVCSILGHVWWCGEGGEVWFGVVFAKSAAICAVKMLVIRWLCGLLVEGAKDGWDSLGVYGLVVKVSLVAILCLFVGLRCVDGWGDLVVISESMRYDE